jgi:phage shock protein A
MALLERVATLVRANLNDLVDKAEDPEKMLKQVMLDMQNQLMQVKTQVAIAIADQHLLEKKAKENAEKATEWMRRAELALEKKQDDALARGALERSMSYQQMQQSFEQQIGDQHAQVEALKVALSKLEQKLAEAKAKSELLIAQAKRSRVAERARVAHDAGVQASGAATFERMKHRVMKAEAVNEAHAELNGDSIDDRFAALERDEQIDRLLAELKQRKGLPA